MLLIHVSCRLRALFFFLLTFILSNCDEPATLPGVQTLEANIALITPNGAGLAGRVTSNGNGTIIEHGFVWDTQHLPTTSLTTKKKFAGSPANDAFYESITGLAEKTTYYLRAYAVNEVGTAYGSEVSFTTTFHIAPTLTTSPAINITYNSAELGGGVSGGGTVKITEIGFVYGKTPHPTTADGKANNPTTLFVKFTGLASGTTYYARVYAITPEIGAVYGNEVQFKTLTPTPPLITTAAATNVKHTSCTVKGGITLAGTFPVTERGIVYGTAENPTTANLKANMGSGTGTFGAELINLTPNTKYYARAYAVTEGGTTFGNQISFITALAELPASILGSWLDIAGITKFELDHSGNVIFYSPEMFYFYEPGDIIAATEGYDVTLSRVGWPSPGILYLRQGTDTNAIKVSAPGSSQQSFWKVVGRSVARVSFGSGLANFAKTQGTTWVEKNDNGQVTSWTYVETSRNDWSVFLKRNDGAEIQIDVGTKAIYFSTTQGGNKTKLYNLTSWENY
jgi:hypothetical protein